MIREEIIKLINEVIDSRTMPDVYSFHDDKWLVPFSRYIEWVKDNEKRIESLNDHLHTIAKLEEIIRILSEK